MSQMSHSNNSAFSSPLASPSFLPLVTPGYTTADDVAGDLDLDRECLPASPDSRPPTLPRELINFIRREKRKFVASEGGSPSTFVQELLQAADVQLILHSLKIVTNFNDVPVKTASGKVKRRGGIKVVSTRQVKALPKLLPAQYHVSVPHRTQVSIRELTSD